MFKKTVETLRDAYNITISNSGPGRTMLMDASVTPKKLLGEFHSSQLALAERNSGAAGVAALVEREPIPGTGVAMPEYREQKSAYVKANKGKLPSVDPNAPIATQLERLKKQAPPGSELEADLSAAQQGIGATPQSFMEEQRARMAEGEATPSVPPQEETDFMEPEK